MKGISDRDPLISNISTKLTVSVEVLTADLIVSKANKTKIAQDKDLFRINVRTQAFCCDRDCDSILNVGEKAIIVRGPRLNSGTYFYCSSDCQIRTALEVLAKHRMNKKDRRVNIRN